MLEGKTQDVLTPLTWGPRQYLIRDMLQFVNDVNAGLEPRNNDRGAAFLRADDWKKAAAGKPPLPEPWSGRLLARPIAGAVTTVAAVPAPKKGSQHYRATLPLGSDHGVFNEMVLWADRKRGGSPVAVTVVSVEKERCAVETMGGELVEGQVVRSVQATGTAE